MYERMLDKSVTPTVADMTAWCGENASNFTLLNEWIAANYSLEQKIVFPYGKRYGWGITHRKKTKLICNVFAENGAFTVMTHLSDKQFQSIYDQLSEYAQKFVDNKYPCGDGGWIHFRTICQAHMEDIQTLLTAKMQKVTFTP